MSYNLQIVEHGNGSIQIKTYSGDMGRARKKKSKSVTTAIKSGAEILEELGFGKCREVSRKRWMETKEEREKRESLNVYNSISRTKKRINMLARSCQWEYFATITVSKKIGDRTDFKLVMGKIRAWLSNMRKRYAPSLKYLAVPEAHKKIEENGKHAWHIHILLADVGDIPFTDSGLVAVGKKAYRREGKYIDYPPIYNLPWAWGYSSAIPITNNEGNKISYYITKYITKEVILLTGKAHKYYASQNLLEANITKMDMPEKYHEEFVKEYLQRHDKKIIYTKEGTKYVKTKFYEIDGK